MPAKYASKTKRTARRRLTVRRQTGEPQATVIPDVPAQPVQPVPFSQPVQPTQPPATSQAQPQVQAVQPQPISVQPAPVSFGNPTSSQPQAEEPEIKLGTEDKQTQSVSDPSQVQASNAPTITEGNPVTQPTKALVKEDNQDQSGGKKNLLLPIIFIVLLGIAVLGGLFIYRQNFSNKQKEKVNVVSLSPTPEEPTPKAVDLSKYTISVLNGSETNGAASNLKSDLEGAGFEVPSIGNADKSDYTETIIQAKENVDKDFLDKLTTALKESFTVGKAEDLGEDAETDVIVIIGSKTAE